MRLLIGCFLPFFFFPFKQQGYLINYQTITKELNGLWWIDVEVKGRVEKNIKLSTRMWRETNKTIIRTYACNNIWWGKNFIFLFFPGSFSSNFPQTRNEKKKEKKGEDGSSLIIHQKPFNFVWDVSAGKSLIFSFCVRNIGNVVETEEREPWLFESFVGRNVDREREKFICENEQLKGKEMLRYYVALWSITNEKKLLNKSKLCSGGCLSDKCLWHDIKILWKIQKYLKCKSFKSSSFSNFTIQTLSFQRICLVWLVAWHKRICFKIVQGNKWFLHKSERNSDGGASSQIN